jgi:hypothetical protein
MTILNVRVAIPDVTVRLAWPRCKPNIRFGPRLYHAPGSGWSGIGGRNGLFDKQPSAGHGQRRKPVSLGRAEQMTA